MATPNKRQTKKAKKSLPKSTTEQRKASLQGSSVSLEFIKKQVELLKPWELSRSQRNITYQAMLRDDAVWSGWELRTDLVMETQFNGKLTYDVHNVEAVKVAAYLTHVMNNMPIQTPRSIAGAAQERVMYGYAPFEMVSKEGKGAWEGYHTLNKLSYISPLTVDSIKPFEFVNGGRKIKYLRQKNAAFKNSDGTNPTTGNSTGYGYKEIDYRKIAMCSYSSSESQPISVSAFDAAYSAWRTKILIQDYSVVGVQKDMAGTPILNCPQALLDEAGENPTGLAAVTLETLKNQMGNLSSGQDAYMILPSDTFSDSGTGQKLWDITFKGIDGTGKQQDLVSMIDQCNKAIHKALGSLNLASAEQGSASYNSLSGTSDILLHYVKQDSRVIDEFWNKQVFPWLMRLNQWEVDSTIMPKWVHGEASPLSLDEQGKYFNRVMRILPAVPEVVNDVLAKSGSNYRLPLTTTPDEVRELMFDFVEESKTGTSEGSSGQGSVAQSNSDTNSENGE